ncbi:MAG: YbhB/YbcL family Raf kinase inhibitor-like protein [candidate division Zixibacteria bacterium]|nr:YbhB/YbcL family Raf kinase inhibitor-like protein [candidate division Zixibacteria bacterium]
MALVIKSDAFEHGEMLPKKYTCDDVDMSPDLKWASIPEGTNSWAIICDDPDAPAGTWVHWVIYKIPAELTSLPANIPNEEEVMDGIRQGKNDFGKYGYGGPCPPPGDPHRYFFKLYALDTMPDWETGLIKAELLEKMEGHIIAEAELMGKYGR